MRSFDYLFGLTAVVVGLGITRLVYNAGKLLVEPGAVAEYWPSYLWVGILLLAFVEFWWWHFGLRERREWTLAYYLLLVASPVLMSLLAVLALPEYAGQPVSVRDHYYKVRPVFYGLAAAVPVLNFLEALARADTPRAVAYYQGGIFVLLLLGALSSDETVHFAIVPAVFAALVALSLHLRYRMRDA